MRRVSAGAGARTQDRAERRPSPSRPPSAQGQTSCDAASAGSDGSAGAGAGAGDGGRRTGDGARPPSRVGLAGGSASREHRRLRALGGEVQRAVGADRDPLALPLARAGRTSPTGCSDGPGVDRRGAVVAHDQVSAVGEEGAVGRDRQHPADRPQPVGPVGAQVPRDGVQRAAEDVLGGDVEPARCRVAQQGLGVGRRRRGRSAGTTSAAPCGRPRPTGTRVIVDVDARGRGCRRCRRPRRSRGRPGPAPRRRSGRRTSG